mgnify:CR=1 FL=1|tara:strand:+ start:411 stop:1211 length:801 start_codon:yes stop_codon:yes gene_type:complete
MNYKKTLSYKSFYNSKYLSLKYKNYFLIYDKLFNKYKNKKIIFVEIGVFSGGSLFMWRNFFGKKAKIIGIDLNPDSKKFEKYGFKIFIGDQSKEIFWKKFFSKVGKVDIILDDGGHTNYQQIMTTNSCIPNIKDNGMLVTEDVHTSFIKDKWYNPSKYSFINYCKKLIDDINTRFPKIKNHNYSLKKYIYSIQNFESIVCFNVNRKLCKINSEIRNPRKSTDPIEFRSKLDKNSFLFKVKKFLNTKTNFTYLVFLINSLKSRKFFK